MTLEEFVNTYKVGSSYGYQGRYIGECVSLVKHYIKEVLDFIEVLKLNLDVGL